MFKEGDEVVLVKPFYYSMDDAQGNEHWDNRLRAKAPHPAYITGIVQRDTLDHGAIAVHWGTKDGGYEYLETDLGCIQLAEPPSEQEIQEAIDSITGGKKVSYDIALLGEGGQPLPTEHFIEGGTHKINGDNACELNVTYNYSEVFAAQGDWSLSLLHGHTAEDTLRLLKMVRTSLGGDKDNPPKPYVNDYWAPTLGNALVVINRLITFAEEHPKGTWQVS